jgi:hypothetical protein
MPAASTSRDHQLRAAGGQFFGHEDGERAAHSEGHHGQLHPGL